MQRNMMNKKEMRTSEVITSIEHWNGPFRQKFYPTPINPIPSDSEAETHVKIIRSKNGTRLTQTKTKIDDESRIQKNTTKFDTNESLDTIKTSATNSEQVSQSTNSHSSKQVPTYARIVTGSGNGIVQAIPNINSNSQLIEGPRGQNGKPSSTQNTTYKKSPRNPDENSSEENDVNNASKSPARKKFLCESDKALDWKALQIRSQNIDEVIKPPADCETRCNSVAAEVEEEFASMKEVQFTRKNAGKGRGNQGVKTNKRKIPGPKSGVIKNVPKARGIQWSNNSCYFDSTIFAMFYKSEYLDPWFLPSNNNAINSLSEDKIASSAVQEKLDKIVQSLRNEIMCPSRLVQDLRNLLSQFNPRLIHIMLDVEEMLLTLCKSGLKMDPFIEYTVGSTNFYHQIFFQNDYREQRTVQELLNNSMEFQKLILAFMPTPALFLKMPRSNGELQHCKFIVPNLELNLHGILQKGNNSDSLMDLRAVICLSNKHYTVYVRDILSKSWCYFDDLGPSIIEVIDIEEQIHRLTISGGKKNSIQNRTLTNMMTCAHFCIYFPHKK